MLRRNWGDGGGGEERRKGFECVKSLCGFETKQQPRVDRRGKGKPAKRESSNNDNQSERVTGGKRRRNRRGEKMTEKINEGKKVRAKNIVNKGLLGVLREILN